MAVDKCKSSPLQEVEGQLAGGRGDVSAARADHVTSCRHTDTASETGVPAVCECDQRKVPVTEGLAVIDSLPFIDGVEEPAHGDKVKVKGQGDSSPGVTRDRENKEPTPATHCSPVPAEDSARGGRTKGVSDLRFHDDTVNEEGWFEVCLHDDSPLATAQGPQPPADLTATAQGVTARAASRHVPSLKKKTWDWSPSHRHLFLQLISPKRLSHHRSLSLFHPHQAPTPAPHPPKDSPPVKVTNCNCSAKSGPTAATQSTATSSSAPESAAPESDSGGGLSRARAFSLDLARKLQSPREDWDGRGRSDSAASPGYKAPAPSKRLARFTWMVGGRRKRRANKPRSRSSRASSPAVTGGKGDGKRASPEETRGARIETAVAAAAANQTGQASQSTHSAGPDDPRRVPAKGRSDHFGRFGPATEAMQATARHLARGARQARGELYLHLLAVTTCGLVGRSTGQGTDHTSRQSVH